MSDFDPDYHDISDNGEKVTFGRVILAVVFLLVVAYIGSKL